MPFAQVYETTAHRSSICDPLELSSNIGRTVRNVCLSHRPDLTKSLLKNSLALEG